ncbi:MAG: NrfD/PsrC family molybdoenzyme membrane anchor subunit, partial [Elusimicrobiota bacterium]
MDPLIEMLTEALSKVSGYIYPNELELQWSILIVLYPYITGLVAGAFILASLERVFNVRQLKPIYRLSLITALAFLFVAPLPLQIHLGHPERAFEIFLTPNTSSAMAMFGFIYVWYLTAVLLLELWFDYRKDIVEWSKTSSGVKRLIYKALTLGVTNISPRSLELDEKIGKTITVIGVPSAILLHGYVGFIFGSVKANPWWSTPLMPVIFLFSAMASGIAAVMLIYMFTSWARGREIDMPCLDTIGK